MIRVTILPYIHQAAYSNGSNCSDYQLDMTYHGLSSIPEVQVQQLPSNPLMFKGCNQNELAKVWGAGFTLYGLLDKKLPEFDIDDSDLIIIAMHHTMCRDQEGFYRAISSVVERYGKNKVCVIDGGDRPEYNEQTASLCTYFKRELFNRTGLAKPLFFAIPEEKFCWSNYPEKRYDFSPHIPAMYCWEPESPHIKTYIYKTEEEYYRQYQQSFYYYLCAKGGIQTGRTLEGIANRSLPFFTDIETYPEDVMHNFPKEMCIDIKKTKGVHPGTTIPYNPEVSTYIGDTRNIKPGEERGYIDWSVFDLDAYNKLLDELMKYAWNNLTTKSLARYILEETL